MQVLAPVCAYASTHTYTYTYTHTTNLLSVGEPLGVDEPETAAAVPCLAVRGRLLPALSPPLSLRLRPAPLLGSELGVLRRGVPELLRRRSMSPAGDNPGEATLESACTIKQSANYRLCCSSSSSTSNSSSSNSNSITSNDNIAKTKE